MVELFKMAGQESIMDGRDFYDDTSRIVYCQVKILDFHDDRLIQISMIKVLISKFRSAGGA